MERTTVSGRRLERTTVSRGAVCCVAGERYGLIGDPGVAVEWLTRLRA